MEQVRIAPLRGTTALLVQRLARRYLGTPRQTSSFCHLLTKLDIHRVGKGLAALLIHDMHLHINGAPFRGKETYA